MTLLEVTVAMTLSGLVLLSGATMLTGLVDRRAQVAAASTDAARRGNAMVLLSLLIANADEPREGPRAVSGDETELALSSWCEAPEGFLVPCSVRLSIVQEGTVHTLWAETNLEPPRGPGPSRLLLAAGADRYSFSYLIDAAAGGSWARSWDHLVPPVAIGVVMGADTTVFPVRGR